MARKPVEKPKGLCELQASYILQKWGISYDLDTHTQNNNNNNTSSLRKVKKKEKRDINLIMLFTI